MNDLCMSGGGGDELYSLYVKHPSIEASMNKLHHLLGSSDALDSPESNNEFANPFSIFPILIGMLACVRRAVLFHVQNQ